MKLTLIIALSSETSEVTLKVRRNLLSLKYILNILSMNYASIKKILFDFGNTM